MSAVNFDHLSKRIGEREADIQSAKTMLADRSVAWAEQPGNVRLREDIDRLESEIQSHEKEIGYLESAKQELTRRDSAAERRRIAGQIIEARKRIDQNHARQVEIAEATIEALGKLAPALAEFQALGDEARQLAHIVIRGAARGDKDSAQAQRSRDVFMQNAERASLRRGPVSIAIAAAMYRAGVGRVGLDLSERVSVLPPDWLGHYAKADILTAMRKDLDKDQSALAYALDAGVKAAQEAAR